MNLNTLVACMSVEAELTEALSEAHKGLQGAPADLGFVTFCLGTRNELLSKHGVLLVDWVMFNQGQSSFQMRAAA